MRKIVCGVCLIVSGLGRAASVGLSANGSLVEAIRHDDVAAVRALVTSGEDVKTPDESGATPLMYAALYSSPDSLSVLVNAGADVNAANSYGATALMWAAARAANVSFLLQHGADANAVASDGVTALVAAARFGNPESMRALLSAGADTTDAATRANLLTAAYFSPEPDVRVVLQSAHLIVSSPDDVKGPVLNRNRGDLAVLRTLLAAGVDPKEEVPLITLSLPSFFLAAREGQVDAMRAFVAAGMDPKFVGPRGWTALMLAAGGDTPSDAAMQYLIDAGIDVNAVDADGRTALDWALTRGHTATAAFLTAHGGRTAVTIPPAPAPAATPRAVGAAIEAAVARLQPAGPRFNDRTKCNSCHNQNIPGIAIALAERHGVPIDRGLAGHSMKATNVQWTNRREAVLLGDTTGGGFQANAEYTLLEMAESHLPPTANSDAIAIGLASRQGADGSWPVGADIRPPLNGTSMTSTALAISALRHYMPEGRREEREARVARGVAFLRHTQPRDTQDQTFKLLGLLWSGAASHDIDAQRAALVALQRPDGGFAQMESMAPDAYATGQALFALHASGMSAADPVYKKGVTYLLRTQLEDGTWFVRTRAFGFQPYFETGFPHGRSQFISTVATAWASMALTYALE